MYGGPPPPRFPGQAVHSRMPLNPDGSEMNEEEKRRFIIQQQQMAGSAHPAMRGITPEMAARMPHHHHHPNQQLRYSGMYILLSLYTKGIS